MKSTALLLAVILFVGGACETKYKTEIITTCDDMLLDIPAKKEMPAPLPQPDHKEATAPKLIKQKNQKPVIGTFVSKGEVSNCGIVPPLEDSIVYTQVEIEAAYPGGAAAWQRFLNGNLRYPAEEIDNETQGSAIVQFVVDEKGNVSDVKAIKGSIALGEEMVRVIKKSGKWVPAVQGGRQVRSLKKQPIVVHLEREG